MSFIFPPISLSTRALVPVELTPRELHRLVRLLEGDAIRAADDPEQVDFADFLFQRAAALREAGR